MKPFLVLKSVLHNSGDLTGQRFNPDCVQSVYLAEEVDARLLEASKAFVNTCEAQRQSGSVNAKLIQSNHSLSADNVSLLHRATSAEGANNGAFAKAKESGDQLHELRRQVSWLEALNDTQSSSIGTLSNQLRNARDVQDELESEIGTQKARALGWHGELQKEKLLNAELHKANARQCETIIELRKQVAELDRQLADKDSTGVDLVRMLTLERQIQTKQAWGIAGLENTIKALQAEIAQAAEEPKRVMAQRESTYDCSSLREFVEEVAHRVYLLKQHKVL